jgi:hypothetical protein
MQYEEAAQAYLRTLSREMVFETTTRGDQRLITLASFAVLRVYWPEVQLFNELLVQYPHGRPPRIRQVVPDNMVVLHDEPIRALTSFNLPLQPAGPFWVLDYISRSARTTVTRRNSPGTNASCEFPTTSSSAPRTRSWRFTATSGASTGSCRQTPFTATPSKNWKWRWAWSMAGLASGFRANCYPCPVSFSNT